MQGRNGQPKAKLSKAKRLMKGLKSGQQIFVVNLNKIKESENEVEPMWLKDYTDLFPEDLTNLPPPRENYHGIEIFRRSEPVTKRPYKMSLPKAIDLKKQLHQLLEQGFIRPSNSPWGAPVLF